jgi:acetolactate synthase-1/2/3 large subunit
MTTRTNGGSALIKSLEHEGVEVIFGLPGGAILPVYDPIIDSPIRHILVRHEQGAGHMAEGYAHATGRPGVAMVTSGPAATNIVTPLADAYMDSIPMVVITGQVPYPAIGTDAFQECDTIGITRSVTKHNELVTRAEDIPLIIRQAFHIATTGRPGPVLVDLPKNIQVTQLVPDYDAPMNLPGYHPEARKPHPEQIAQVAAAIKRAKRPVIYAGGGTITGDASEELRELSRRTGIPVTMTLMGLGAFPADNPLCLDMLGMHGSVYANYAVDQADLLIAVGVVAARDLRTRYSVGVAVLVAGPAAALGVVLVLFHLDAFLPITY